MRIGYSCVLIIFGIFILVELNNKTNIMEINLKYAIAEKWKAPKKFWSYLNKYYIKKYKTNYYYYII